MSGVDHIDARRVSLYDLNMIFVDVGCSDANSMLF